VSTPYSHADTVERLRPKEARLEFSGESRATRLQRLYDATRPATSDLAAYGGRVNRSIRNGRRRRATEAKIGAIVRQQERVENLRNRLRRAETREAKTLAPNLETGQVR
jgi:hypothetical protein